jgi:pimeloyl-ACP methyl ester carboxylesterase
MLKERTALICGAELAWDEAGQGEPIVLLHPGIGDRRLWDDQFEVFSRTHQVVRPDIRGFGHSTMPPGAFSYHEDLAGLLDELGLEKASIVGVSFGGRVAIDFAIAFPERVTALVLGAPSVTGAPAGPERSRFETEEEEAIERGDLDGATELNLRTWVDGPKRSPEEVDPGVRERVRLAQRELFDLPMPEGADYRRLVPPAYERLSEIMAPTRVLIGDQDLQEVEEMAARVAAQVRGAELIQMRGVGHMLHMERPEDFNRMVLEFLDRPR